MNTNTEKTVRITKAMRYAEIRELIPAERTDLLDFIDHEVSLLGKKNRADRKPTAKEVETAELREHLVALLTSEARAMSVSEIMQVDEAFNGMSNQRITALLKGLLDEGRVIRTVEKRVAHFAIAA